MSHAWVPESVKVTLMVAAATSGHRGATCIGLGEDGCIRAGDRSAGNTQSRVD